MFTQKKLATTLMRDPVPLKHEALGQTRDAMWTVSGAFVFRPEVVPVLQRLLLGNVAIVDTAFVD